MAGTVKIQAQQNTHTTKSDTRCTKQTTKSKQTQNKPTEDKRTSSQTPSKEKQLSHATLRCLLGSRDHPTCQDPRLQELQASLDDTHGIQEPLLRVICKTINPKQKHAVNILDNTARRKNFLSLIFHGISF